MTETLNTLYAGVGDRLLGCKYLTFFLDGQEYGLDILGVREIVGAKRILPTTAQVRPHVKGVMNIRGRIVPVVDLRRKCASYDDQPGETCTVIAQTNGVQTGIIVDRISEVCDIVEGDIDEARPSDASVPDEFILGISKVNDRTVILLDIAQTLTETERKAILVLADGGHATW